MSYAVKNTEVYESDNKDSLGSKQDAHIKQNSGDLSRSKTFFRYRIAMSIHLEAKPPIWR